MSTKSDDTIFVFAKPYFTQIGLMNTLENWFPNHTIILANDFDLKTIGSISNSVSNTLVFALDDFTSIETNFKGFDELDQNDYSTIVIAEKTNQEDLAAAVVAGVSGYFSVDSDEKELKEGFQNVMKGQNFYTRKSIETISTLGQPAGLRHAKRKVADLTRRQREVLNLIGQGHSNSNIATKLELSPNTVRIHISAIFKTLDVSNRTQAALLVQ